MAISKEQIQEDINTVDDIYDKCRKELRKQKGSHNVSLYYLKNAMLNYLAIMEYAGEDKVRINRLRNRVNNKL